MHCRHFITHKYNSSHNITIKCTEHRLQILQWGILTSMAPIPFKPQGQHFLLRRNIGWPDHRMFTIKRILRLILRHFMPRQPQGHNIHFTLLVILVSSSNYFFALLMFLYLSFPGHAC